MPDPNPPSPPRASLPVDLHDRCGHGMVRATCYTCSPPRKPKVPQRRATTTAPSHGAVAPSTTEALSLVVVRTNRPRDQVLRHGLDAVDATTRTVHVNGPLFLWVVEALLQRAPNLQVIQVIPAALGKCHPESHHAICAARGVTIRAGHVRPESVWEDERSCSPHFDAQRRFFETLAGPQLQLFEELEALGFEAATIVQRYYGVRGGARTYQRVLAEEFGVSGESAISAIVGGVLHYLDDTTEVGTTARERSSGLRTRVARLRAVVADVHWRARVAASLGIPTLPEALPVERLDDFRALVAARRDGRLDALRREDERAHDVLTLRFGLRELDRGVFRTLKEVGAILGGGTAADDGALCRERVRQLEERGLKALGIGT